jgi:hypothetical protein
VRTWQELRPRPAIKPECLLVHGQITLRGPGNSPIRTGPRLFIDLKRICPAALLNRVMATPDNRPQLKPAPAAELPWY